MAVLLSYTNARGEEIVLDDTERSFLGELYGREGTEAPELDYSEVTYADGSTEILAINPKPREVTFYFWAPTGKPHLREAFEELKQKLIQTGNKSGGWGKLMVRRPDGRQLYLDCAYTGGLDEFVREYPRVAQFALTFRARDPYFYDGFEQTYTIRQNDKDGYLFMDPGLYMADAAIVSSQAEAIAITGESTAGNLWWSIGGGKYYAIKPASSLYMMSAQGKTGSDLFINGEKVYPTIIINGPAENIWIRNNSTRRIIRLAASVVLDVNEKITINTQPMKRSITMKDKTGTTTNLLPKLTTASTLNWWLVRGSNDIEFNNSATTPETYLQFKYKEGYLSAE